PGRAAGAGACAGPAAGRRARSAGVVGRPGGIGRRHPPGAAGTSAGLRPLRLRHPPGPRRRGGGALFQERVTTNNTNNTNEDRRRGRRSSLVLVLLRAAFLSSFVGFVLFVVSSFLHSL